MSRVTYSTFVLTGKLRDVNHRPDGTRAQLCKQMSAHVYTWDPKKPMPVLTHVSVANDKLAYDMARDYEKQGIDAAVVFQLLGRPLPTTMSRQYFYAAADANRHRRTYVLDNE